MADFPAMPLWTDAYLADCSHLSDAEHGLYLRLMMMLWRSPECRIPDDDAWIARRLAKTPEEMADTVRPLLGEFFTKSGSWLIQKRLLREWNFLQEKRKKNVSAAKSRWDKEKGACERISKRNAPTPTSIKKENYPSGSQRKSAAGAPKSTGTRIPSDWICSEKNRVDARKIGMSHAQIELETSRFRDHWLAADGPTAIKRDWDAAWRNWCRKALEFQPKSGNGNGRKPPSLSRAIRNLLGEEGPDSEAFGEDGQPHLTALAGGRR